MTRSEALSKVEAAIVTAEVQASLGRGDIWLDISRQWLQLAESLPAQPPDLTWHSPEHHFQPAMVGGDHCHSCGADRDSLRHRAVYTDDTRAMP